MAIINCQCLIVALVILATCLCIYMKAFSANHFRLYLHSAAYVLIRTLQKEVLKGTEFCKATMKRYS